jgi:hypothetical protein
MQKRATIQMLLCGDRPALHCTALHCTAQREHFRRFRDKSTIGVEY